MSACARQAFLVVRTPKARPDAPFRRADTDSRSGIRPERECARRELAGSFRRKVYSRVGGYFNPPTAPPATSFDALTEQTPNPFRCPTATKVVKPTGIRWSWTFAPACVDSTRLVTRPRYACRATTDCRRDLVLRPFDRRKTCLRAQPSR